MIPSLGKMRHFARGLVFELEHDFCFENRLQGAEQRAVISRHGLGANPRCSRRVYLGSESRTPDRELGALAQLRLGAYFDIRNVGPSRSGRNDGLCRGRLWHGPGYGPKIPADCHGDISALSQRYWRSCPRLGRARLFPGRFDTMDLVALDELEIRRLAILAPSRTN